jgi:hypothetical protein
VSSRIRLQINGRNSYRLFHPWLSACHNADNIESQPDRLGKPAVSSLLFQHHNTGNAELAKPLFSVP